MKKKYTIKKHGNGIYEVQVSMWVWSCSSYLTKALKEISETCTVASVTCFGIPFARYIYIITTVPM